VTGCGPKGRFACFETAGHAGTVIGISDVSGSRGRFFVRLRTAAADWDRSDPVRPIG
jgi:hypothetical protein